MQAGVWGVPGGLSATGGEERVKRPGQDSWEDEAQLVAEARRTIPGPGDGQLYARTVDPDVWLDHVRFARTQDGAALERLVEEYSDYARSLARRLQRHGETGEDLEQVALEALLLALHRFDVERSRPFVAFASPTILGSLRRHFRDRGWLLRVPRSVHEVTAAANQASQELTGRLGRVPSVNEVADHLGVPLEDLLAARSATVARGLVSLDDGDGVDGVIAPQIGAIDRNFEITENRVALERAMNTLEEDDRTLLRRYYVDEQTQAGIAADLGVSQMEISRRLGRLIGRLRQQLDVE